MDGPAAGGRSPSCKLALAARERGALAPLRSGRPLVQASFARSACKLSLPPQSPTVARLQVRPHSRDSSADRSASRQTTSVAPAPAGAFNLLG